jgi:hypothetical protein
MSGPMHFFNANRIPINTFALSARLPTMLPFRELVEAGGVMCYGPNYVSNSSALPNTWTRFCAGPSPLICRSSSRPSSISLSIWPPHLGIRVGPDPRRKLPAKPDRQHVWTPARLRESTERAEPAAERWPTVFRSGRDRWGDASHDRDAEGLGRPRAVVDHARAQAGGNRSTANTFVSTRSRRCLSFPKFFTRLQSTFAPRRQRAVVR